MAAVRAKFVPWCCASHKATRVKFPLYGTVILALVLVRRLKKTDPVSLYGRAMAKFACPCCRGALDGWRAAS